MNNPTELKRFIDAQQTAYATALAEIKNGRKRSHWMWYIFPQVRGLGLSALSRQHAIDDLAEATAFLQDPVLGSRLLNICRTLLSLPGNDAHAIFGDPDDMKLKSSMTLFAAVKNSDPVFQSVLDKFFNGKKDERTLQLIGLPGN